MDGYAYAQDSSEAAKIRYLIGSVEALQGVKFLGNGSEFAAKKVADHLLRLSSAPICPKQSAVLPLIHQMFCDQQD